MDKTTPFKPWTAEESAKSVHTEREAVDDAKLHRENVNHPKHTQTASYDKESIAVASNAPGSSSILVVDTDPDRGKESKMDTTKVASMQQIVENTLSQEGRQRVSQLLEAVEALSGAERLLLYLRLPTGVPPHDPLKQPINPLGSRAELQQTVTWIQTHLEVDPDVSLPKQDVYDEYIAHCMTSNMKPLSTADFGKVMKQVYPSVRPRRLGTRGNSRYCYAGLRKKVKLEVPQLPALGDSSKLQEVNIPSKETERIVCDWAESKLGIKFANISELSRHLMAAAMQHAPPGPASSSPPPLGQPHVPPDEAASRQLITQLKRKIQGTPGRPKKKKAQEAGESPPSTSYVHHQPVKHEEPPESYGYQPPYMPVYDVRPPYPAFGPPRAHPPAPGEYRPDTYPYEQQGYARDLSLPDPALNLPINLSSDARDAAERTEWARRRPPEPPPRLPLPGKKLILETYQSETQGGSPRAIPEPRPPPVQEEFPRAEYLPKKMRAAEISGGKLAAQRHAAASDGASTSTEPTLAFLEDPKNLTSRSKSTAAALARDIQEAASPKRVKRAPTPRQVRGPRPHARPRGSSADRARSPDTCCGLDGINIKTGVICDEKHTEILNRERVISICNIDKHDLDDYLNEGNSQEHEEELLKYFQAKEAEAEVPPVAVASAPAPACGTASFSETNQDPQDDHSQGKNEKISQLRELLAKNLKSQNSSSQSVPPNQEQQPIKENSHEQTLKLAPNDGAFKPLADVEISNGPQTLNQSAINGNKMFNSVPNENGTAPPLLSSGSASHGNCHNDPQSPTSRTQQYDFVPISDGCQSPANFNSKSPVGFGQRGLSPTKINKSIMSNSLQTSPISHSTAASPFVSPRNTPVPRSRLCSRPIPKLNGRKRRNPLSLGVSDQCHKQFAIPNDQKFMSKMPVCGPGKFCQSIQPMSAPPSPNILTSQYKTHMFHCAPNIPNGVHNLSLNFLPNVPIRDHIDRELAQPLSADPLSSEVSQFFQEPLVNYRPAPDSFRSQSVPLKQGINNMCLLSYNNTPVGSVPPTPVPNEFCDFGSLADTCDISKAGLNPETLDKIYNAIDSSNDVLNTNAAQTLLNSNDALTNGCDPIPEQAILSDEQLNSLIPSGEELLDRGSQFSQPFNNDAAPTDNVEDFLKRPNSIEFDLSELETDKNKYYTSRSVPSTPLPFKRTASNLQIDSCRSRELFPADAYTNASNGISSKSVPSTPQMVEERSVFSYSNRDYLINGNSVGGSAQMHDIVMDNDQSLASPLNDMLREDMLNPLTPALLADLDKMDTPYVDL